MQKLSICLGLALSLSVIATPSIQAADETEPAVSSTLTAISLPANAHRVLPSHIPGEVQQTLEKLIAASNGKVRQGETEVLIWTGANYKKAAAPHLIDRLTNTLKMDGWKYEGAQENGVTFFGLVKENGHRRAILGFHGATDEALVFAWTELLALETSAATSALTQARSNGNTTTNSVPREWIGTWDNGSVSMLQRKDTITGTTTPGRSSYFSYSFAADGTFQFIGLMQTTNYSCATKLFNDKAGRVRVAGNTVTFIPSKNYWKNTSCVASQNSEKNHTLTEETYQWRTKTDEYGKRLICLSNDKGESCYRFKEK